MTNAKDNDDNDTMMTAINNSGSRSQKEKDSVDKEIDDEEAEDME